jgi:hypothetical protein
VAAVATKRVAEREIGKAFEEWWPIYPRKEAKKAARVAYGRVVHKGEATIAELLAGAKRYAAACAGKERRYIKLPAGWLYDGRWADEGESTAAIIKPILWPELVEMFTRRGFWPGLRPGFRLFRRAKRDRTAWPRNSAISCRRTWPEHGNGWMMWKSMRCLRLSSPRPSVAVDGRPAWRKRSQ